ncbi:hypothetical protein ACGFYA_20635 [Streptomyces sp. NPDC048305]
MTRECENDGCNTPINKAVEFCSGECWDEWHAKYSPETLAQLTPR